MSRKKRLLIGIVLTPMVCAVAFLALDGILVEEPSVTKANFDRIQLGMSPEDVRVILGNASDHYFPKEGRGWVWEGAEGNAYILFGTDGDGPVSELTWIDLGRTEEQKAEWERQQIAWGRERRISLLRLRLRRFLDQLAFWK